MPNLNVLKSKKKSLPFSRIEVLLCFPFVLFPTRGKINNLWSITSTFYNQLLRTQIPKAQKRLTTKQSFCAFGIRSCKTCSLGVNFINILKAHFSPMAFHQKVSKPNVSALMLFFGAKIFVKNARVKC